MSIRGRIDEAIETSKQLAIIQAITGADDEEITRLHHQAAGAAPNLGLTTAAFLAMVAETLKYPPQQVKRTRLPMTTNAGGNVEIFHTLRRRPVDAMVTVVNPPQASSFVAKVIYMDDAAIVAAITDKHGNRQVYTNVEVELTVT